MAGAEYPTLGSAWTLQGEIVFFQGHGSVVDLAAELCQRLWLISQLPSPASQRPSVALPPFAQLSLTDD